MKKKGGLRYSDAMYLFKTTPIITYWLPQAGLPILPNIEECVLTFTNTTYSSLHIKLPNPIIDIAGTQIKLPTMSGQYEDEYNFYTPLRWSVGDFGQVIKLKRHNFTANLEFTVVPKIVTYTIDFTNTTYPQFHVILPEALIVPEGDSAILPSVTGTFEDEEYIYTPQEWSIGNFGDTYTPSANVTTNLIWNVQPKTVTYTLSFTNTEYPEFDLPLPEPIIAEEGSSVTLPSVTGDYEDDLNTYTPVRWDLGDFGDSVTLDENKVADLIWLVEPIQGRLPLGGTVGLSDNVGENLYYDYDALILDLAPNYTYSLDLFDFTPVLIAEKVELDTIPIYDYAHALSDFALLDGGTVIPWTPSDNYIYLGGLITTTTDTPLRVEWVDGLVEAGGYAYSDGQLIGGDYPYGGMVEWDRPNSMFGIMNADSEYSLLPFDDSYTEIMNVTGYQYNHAEFIEDPNIDWLLSLNTLMKVWDPNNTEEGKCYIVINNNDDITNSIALDDTFIHQIQHSVEVVTFYFTNLGSQETEDTLLEVGRDIPLYNADGTLANEEQYDGVVTVTFTQSNGNMFETPLYSNLVSLSNGNLILRTNISYTAISVQVEDISLIPLCGTLTPTSSTSMKVKELPCGILVKDNPNLLIIDFAFAFDSSTGTIPEQESTSESDWWYSAILTQQDKDRLNAFGLQVDRYNNRMGTIGSVVYDSSYTFEMIGMFANVVNGQGSDSISFDLSKFSCARREIGSQTYLVINHESSAFPSPAKVWRCKITKQES